MKFWQIYRYAHFTVDGTEYRKLRRQLDVTGGIVNAENITSGAKVFFLDHADVTPLENQDTKYRQPTVCEPRLRF